MQLRPKYQAYQGALLRHSSALQSSEAQEVQLQKQRQLIARIGKPSGPPSNATKEERLVDLVIALRAAENPTRTSMTKIGPAQTLMTSQKQPVTQLYRPMTSIVGASTAAIQIEGTYTSLPQLEEFLSAGRATGAALTALNVHLNTFQATLSIYVRT